MKNSLLLLLFLGISVLNGWGQPYEKQGSFYLCELQYGKAKAWFQAVLKNSPENETALVGLGDSYLGLNKVDSAKMLFQKASSLNPKNPFALAGMGKVALVNNDRNAESDYFDRARRADKTNPEVYCAIAEGCINRSRQDTTTALLFIYQGLNINQKYSNLHLATGNLETLKKNYGLAANAYDRAIFFDSKSYIAYRNRGYIDYLSRSYQDALKAYNKSIEILPEQILIYKYLGDLYYSAGRYSEAEKAYQTYLARAEITTDDKERYAITLFFNKKYNEAASLLEQVLAVNHDESVLLRIRGYIAYETGDFQKGLEYMNNFFALHHPKKLISTDYSYYAKILQKIGKDTLAIENFEKALTLDPAKTDLYDDLANLAAKNKMHKEAAGYYKKMLDSGADKVVTNFQIGKEFYFEGDIWKSRFDSLLKLHQTKDVPFADSLRLKENMKTYFTKADSAFTIVNQLSSDYAGGYIWKGRIQSVLDPEADRTAAKDAYERALSLLEKGELAKNRKAIIECYKYLGSWHFLRYEKLYKSDKQESAAMRSKMLAYFTKISELDPQDAQAKEVLAKMKQKK
jgi:tetratricopeptide (TPR) repeat protein